MFKHRNAGGAGDTNRSDIISPDDVPLPHEVLSPVVVAQIFGLNRDFVALLIALHAGRGDALEADSLSLPARVSRGLAALSPPALDALALCRFSLFTLSLNSTELWQRLRFAGVDDSALQRYGAGGDVPSRATARSTFLHCALVFAWHLAQVNRWTARIVLGMRDETLGVFRDMPLWQLQRIALEYPQLLAPRWPDNPGFWPDLIRLADGPAAQLEGVRLLGAQLIARELEPSTIQRLMANRSFGEPGRKPPRR